MISEVTSTFTVTVEAHTLDDAEELVADLIAQIEFHPQVLSEVDPKVRAHHG